MHAHKNRKIKNLKIQEIGGNINGIFIITKAN